jgi:hypothetical protein
VPKPSCGFSSDREKIDLLLVVGEPRDYHAGETGSRKGSWKRRRLNTFQLFDDTGSQFIKLDSRSSSDDLNLSAITI